MALLRDTFYCLASDSIKLASLKSKGGEDEAENEQEMAGKVLEAAKKVIISGVVKKNVMENIIPIIIALKHKLESVKSPLVSDLFKYLRKLMEDYKNEVTDILAADKQLAKEIEFDLRRFDQEQEEIKERQEQERLARELRHSESRLGTPRASAPGTPRSPAQGSPAPSSAPSPRSGSSTPGKAQGGCRPDLMRQALQNALTATAKKRRESGAKMASKLLESFNAANIEAAEKSVNAEVDKEKPADKEAVTNASTNEAVANASTNDKKDASNVEKSDHDEAVEENQEKEGMNPVRADGVAADGKEAEVTKQKADDEEEVEKGASPHKDVVSEDDPESELSPELNPEAPADEVSTGQKDDKEGAKDLNKSKRVSGQGMERQKQMKTPRSRKIHNVRAISTPQVNKTVLGDNVTFLGESVLDLSCITVLSPPSSLNDPDSRRGSTSARNKDDTDAVSFRFRKGGKDMFEELVDVGEGGTGKRKSEEGRTDDRKRVAGGRKTGSGGSLGVIQEEGGKRKDGKEK